MKIFYREHSHSYKTYAFGYAVYGVAENNDIVDDIYNKGFLPFSGNAEIRDTYYLARSARVILSEFDPSSENRRVLKKFNADDFTKTVIDKELFLNDSVAIEFCLNYFRLRHGENVFSEQRLTFIVNFSDNVRIIEYKDTGGNIVAYVIGIVGQNFFHYWFSFFAEEYFHTSFGVFLMLSSLMEQKTLGTQYVYLGTVYGAKALYKTNFSPLEFWNGELWSTDVALLKELARTDTEREVHRIGL